MIRWLSAWLRKPFKVNGGPFSARRAYGLPSAEEHEAKNAMFRRSLAAMDAPAKPTASDAARILSRHGHAEARAKIRAKADEMNAAMGRAKVVWP